MDTFIRHLLCSFLAILPVVSAAQDKPAFDIEIDGRLSVNIGGYHRIEADLGNLPLASVGHVKLHVQNPFDEDIEFGDYFLGCSCLTATLSSKVLKANGTIDIDFGLTTILICAPFSVCYIEFSLGSLLIE